MHTFDHVWFREYPRYIQNHTTPYKFLFLKQLKMYNPVFLQPVINFLKHFRSYKFMGVTDDHFLFTVNAYNTHCLYLTVL